MMTPGFIGFSVSRCSSFLLSLFPVLFPEHPFVHARKRETSAPEPPYTSPFSGSRVVTIDEGFRGLSRRCELSTAKSVDRSIEVE